jgi:hypothetical protein
MIRRQYLGDGVYADFDGYHIVLTTSDGQSITNRIALEPPVLAALGHYVEQLRGPEREARSEHDDG